MSRDKFLTGIKTDIHCFDNRALRMLSKINDRIGKDADEFRKTVINDSCDMRVVNKVFRKIVICYDFWMKDCVFRINLFQQPLDSPTGCNIESFRFPACLQCIVGQSLVVISPAGYVRYSYPDFFFLGCFLKDRKVLPVGINQGNFRNAE